MSDDHPDRQCLFAFGHGLLNSEEAIRIEQHLQECTACCETLVDLKDDTFVGLVRSVQVSIADTECDLSPPGDKQTCHQGNSSDSFAPTIVELSHSDSTPIASVEDCLPELTGHPRYRIIAPVGRGGMGSVYKAEHRLMQRSAAIKVINPELIRHPLAVERFRREVRAAAKLSHPNIVAAWDAEQAGNLHLLVMEFVDGTDLATIVQQRGPLDVSQACNYITQAARGLQHAYEKGMVHRDIKPHNLMLTPDGRVRILDFGLAGIVSDDDKTTPDSADGESTSNTAGHLTSIGSVMGTPDYMAPEQAVDAHSADIRADIYSLGCTLCFLLTGQPPFEAGGVAEKLTAHAQKVPQQLTERRKDVPLALNKVADRLLAKKPEDRFQTPAEVVAALEPFTQARQSGQRLAGRWVAAALAGFFLLLAAIIIVVTDRGQLEIQSEVDDVKIVVKKDGKQVEVFDLKTGSQMKWVPGGEYELEVVGSSNDVKLDKAGFTMSRLGQVIVTAKWSSERSGVIRSFSTTDDPITQDGISVDDGGWKIVATTPGTVQLFEISDPNLADGPFFFRAKLRTNNLVGRAYLEMRNRIPNQGEFFSKGLQSALSGTNDWTEYEIPYFLKNGEQPDLVNLNVTIEGTGTVWIKDIELRGKLVSPAETDLDQLQGSTKLETPKASDDPAAAQASPEANLLTDPSFENTGLTQLPNGWRAWLNDGPEFRCEVVAGGHTGQRCLQISGKGTRGVVFANDLKVDRSKRYALKGWAKFEGDQSARAIIKLNYFRGSEFLGVHDLVGAMADQGWQHFEKTDALDAFPTADHFYAMCHVEGSGTGWFDDLELVAYDRDTLPKDFDLRHGRHNRQHGPNSLHRWLGTWRTEYAFREFDDSPTETKLTMTITSERTLGDYFLMSHAKAEPVAPQDRRPTPADPPSDVAILGGEERLSFLFFDQNLGAFRQWDFSSNGKAFEWRGLWDNDRQTLELRMLPDASNLHSSEHFIDGDHIEGELKFQYVMGQRDAGRWTATRKAFDGKVDIPIAKTHVASSAELSQLDKFVGEWDLQATFKPSVWKPQQREERARESSQWILGGRFVMTRSFNEKGELTSIWIATCDPREKSNRLWSFRADGSSGESRLTWDEAASGFQFRAMDMPSGWTGTGFNHWVDADSFDNTAIIKDENGRVLLDMTQARGRKK